MICGGVRVDHHSEERLMALVLTDGLSCKTGRLVAYVRTNGGNPDGCSSAFVMGEIGEGAVGESHALQVNARR